MKNIYLFTLKNCQRCLSLKKTFDEKEIKYIEIDSIENNLLWNEIVSKTKTNVVPTIFIGQENGEMTEGYVYIPGRDFITDEELLDKIKP